MPILITKKKPTTTKQKTKKNKTTTKTWTKIYDVTKTRQTKSGKILKIHLISTSSYCSFLVFKFPF